MNDTNSPLIDPVKPLEPVNSQSTSPTVPPAGLPPLHNVPSAPTNFDVPAPKSPKKKIFMILGIVLGVLLFGLTTASVAAAYGKIPVPYAMKMALQAVVLSVPFMPKTPEYVLGRTVLAHLKVASAEVDASFALQQNNFIQSLGFGGSDLGVKGLVDLRDQQNPKSDIQILFGNSFDAHFISTDKKGYINLNKFPSTVLAFVGLKIDDSKLLNKWYFYDFSNPDTPARSLIGITVDKSPKNEFDTKYSDLVTTVFTEDILPAVKMTTIKESYGNAFELKLDITPELYKKIVSKYQAANPSPYGKPLSDSDIKSPFKTAELVLKIDTKTYFLRELTFQGELSSENPSSGGIGSYTGMLTSGVSGEPVKFATVFKLSRIGETFDIKAPVDSTSIDELYKELLASSTMVSMNIYGSAPSQSKLAEISVSAEEEVQLANMEKLITDVSTDINNYYKVYKEYPKSIYHPDIPSQYVLGSSSVEKRLRTYGVKYTFDGRSGFVYTTVNSKHNLFPSTDGIYVGAVLNDGMANAPTRYDYYVLLAFIGDGQSKTDVKIDVKPESSTTFGKMLD